MTERGIMGKHRVSSLALCEYYKHEDRQMVYCDGPRKGSVIHVAFPDGSSCRAYKREYCYRDFKKCEVCKMLDRVYGGDK